MDEKKLSYIAEDFEGWRYIWITREVAYGNVDTFLHELYKKGNKLMWTGQPVDPMADAEVLRSLAEMLENGIIFTEEELDEYNRS